ncbi:MAG: CDP-alcohol phosphatidyltransferase family protein [Bacilli bacterium]
MNVFKKSCLITYFGIIFGVLSVWYAFNKCAFNEVNVVKYTLICLMLSGICDMFDGKFARMCKRSKEEKEFGIQLDSLADTFCFLAVPIVIMLAIGMNNWYHIIVYSYFIICGVTRLGWFNVNADSNKPVDYFTGIPVTSTAIIYPLVGLLHTLVSEGIFEIILIVITLLIGFLFNFKIKIPKFKGNWYYILMPILAIILAIIMVIL